MRTLPGLLVAISAVIACTPSIAQVLSIGSETISATGTATVNLDISGLGGGTALGTFDVNVAFAPGVLSFASASYGDPVLGDQLDLEGYGTLTSTTPGTGTTELFELSFDSPAALTTSQASKFTLATLTFNAVAPGSSPLTLSISALGDQNGGSIAASLQNGIVTVSAVPEPDVVWLFLAGVGVLGITIRCDRSKIALSETAVA